MNPDLISQTVDGITVLDILAGLGAVGFGGVITALINKRFQSNKEGAETDEILNRTNRSIAEIVEKKTERLKAEYAEVQDLVSTLQDEIRGLNMELDSNRQIMRIRALEADVKFYMARVQILEAQNQSILEGWRERDEHGN